MNENMFGLERSLYCISVFLTHYGASRSAREEVSRDREESKCVSDNSMRCIGLCLYDNRINCALSGERMNSLVRRAFRSFSTWKRINRQNRLRRSRLTACEREICADEISCALHRGDKEELTRTTDGKERTVNVLFNYAI